MIECPIDGWKDIETNCCPQCKTDLSSIHRIKELPDVLYNQAVVLIRDANYTEAANRLQVAIHINPLDVTYHTLLAKTLAVLGQYDSAVAILNKGLQLDAGNSQIKELILQIEKYIENESAEKRLADERNGRKTKLLISAPFFAFILGIVSFIVFQTAVKPSREEIIRGLQIAFQNEECLKKYESGIAKFNDGIVIKAEVPSLEIKKLLVADSKVVVEHRYPLYFDITVAANKNDSLYSIKAGDNLWRISYRFFGRGDHWEILYNANKTVLGSPHKLEIGRQIIIPGRSSK